jgi:hypothetical protein
LTPEQKERMRLNRERALARRKAPQTTLPIDTTAQTTSQGIIMYKEYKALDFLLLMPLEKVGRS